MKVNLLIFMTLFSSLTPSYGSDRLEQQLVTALYQLDDEAGAGFDFFTTQKRHKCAGNLSSRYRSYSRDPDVAQRNFQLVLTALESNKPLSFRVRRCEGKAMLIDQLGLHR